MTELDRYKNHIAFSIRNCIVNSNPDKYKKYDIPGIGKSEYDYLVDTSDDQKYKWYKNVNENAKTKKLTEELIIDMLNDVDTYELKKLLATILLESLTYAKME